MIITKLFVDSQAKAEKQWRHDKQAFEATTWHFEPLRGSTWDGFTRGSRQGGSYEDPWAFLGPHQKETSGET